jgi:DNA replication protein DnaC
LLTNLGIARMDGRYNRILSQLKKCNLLVMDDWGFAEITVADRRDILVVIEVRINTGENFLSALIPTQAVHPGW